jgi:hypothetical protein
LFADPEVVGKHDIVAIYLTVKIYLHYITICETTAFSLPPAVVSRDRCR